MKMLILGGARSGKSRYAEECVKTQDIKTKIYIATALAGDTEMQQRIDQHQSQRDSTWHLAEEPLLLADCIKQWDDPNHVILVDCLTLWLCQTLERNIFIEQREKLFATLNTVQADVVLVSNEVGSGIVPLGQLSRQFVDEAGRLNQSLAQMCEKVSLVVAGLPLPLKTGI